MNHKCPDCKTENLKLINKLISVGLLEIDAEHYFKCPKCLGEWDEEELEEW